ncbi:MAG: hypothetical protein O3A00_02630 [Planctomycetota bacterium]|nr:hypothetical protein [Planctomycetota bacterium]
MTTQSKSTSSNTDYSGFEMQMLDHLQSMMCEAEAVVSNSWLFEMLEAVNSFARTASDRLNPIEDSIDNISGSSRFPVTRTTGMVAEVQHGTRSVRLSELHSTESKPLDEDCCACGFA